MSLLNRFFSYLKTITSPYLYWVLFLHFLYLFQIHSTESMGGFYFNVKGIFLILISFLPVICLFYGVNFILNPYPRLLVLGNIGLLLFYGLFAGYHFHARTQFIWDMFRDNIANAFYLESVIFMWNSLNKDVLLYFCFFVFILLFMQWRYRSISRYANRIQSKRPILVVVALYSFCLISNVPCYDPISGFFKSIYVYYFKSSFNVAYEEGTYPLIKYGNEDFNFFSSTQTKKPTVFLIVAESLNQSIIHKKTSYGEPITPFLNELEKSSLVVENFYANSIQSAKARVSLFLSLIPSISNKMTTQFTDLNVLSMADVMEQNGYGSVLFHACDLNGFDNSYIFFRDRGFIMETVKSYLKEDDSPYIWRSWGPEDNVFFKRFFDYYDQQNFKDQPMFYSLITVASHVPFSIVPKERRLLYENPQSIHEEYANSMHLVDKGIAVFFDELKKRGLYDSSIVIITSDHTIPMGEHGIYHQEAGYYEESFRIPFYVHWPNQIKPQVITKPFSQLDIAPTILDMIDADVSKHSFMGRSIFSDRIEPVYLIQPYGKHLAIVDWPYKFIWHSRSGTASVYDLEKDPMETNNIVRELPADIYAAFKKSLNQIHLNQLLYKNNVVYSDDS
ncbi:MAG: hypothetical protein CMP21_00275 [Rickettsiales bacterium]|nr:hypothetical protein [Rickettsiales bacterium]